MPRLARLFGFALALAVCFVAWAIPSKADDIDTFKVTGTFNQGSINGSTTFDETTNTMTFVDIFAPGTGTGPFTVVGGFASNGGGGTVVGVNDGLGDFLFLNFQQPGTPGSILGYNGGALGSTTWILTNTGGGNFIVSGKLTPTPEPSALVLSSLGLLGLGIVGYKMKLA